MEVVAVWNDLYWYIQQGTWTGTWQILLGGRLGSGLNGYLADFDGRQAGLRVEDEAESVADKQVAEQTDQEGAGGQRVVYRRRIVGQQVT